VDALKGCVIGNIVITARQTLVERNKNKEILLYKNESNSFYSDTWQSGS